MAIDSEVTDLITLDAAESPWALAEQRAPAFTGR